MKNPVSFGFILRNFWYKLAALFMALVVWGIVQSEQTIELNRRIKISFRVAPGYVVKDKPFRYVDAKLRGARALMGDFSRPIEARIDIPSGQTGTLEIAFDPKAHILKGWDERISVDLRDPYISVFVDEKITRTVPIREVLQGAPADGFFVEKVTLQPEKIKLSGPKSEFAKLEDVVTEPIDITGLKQSKTIETTILTQGFEIEGSGVNLVKVALQVGDSKINKRFGTIPVRIVGNTKAVSNLRPRYVSIVIQGTPGILNFVSKNDLRAFIEVTDLGPGRHEKEIQVKIPPDTVLIETFPAKGFFDIVGEKG